MADAEGIDLERSTGFVGEVVENFDARVAFPGFKPIDLEEGIRLAHREEFAISRNANAARAS